jgi:CheY-like chemotaxis protein
MDIELTLDAFKQARLSNHIEVADNGQQALDYLLGNEQYADRIKHPLPDLILLDLKMPGIDGFEVLSRIKQTPGIKRIPVVILTSSKEEGDRALSYDIGANSYLVKPVAFTGFIDVVRRIEDYWLTLNVGAPVRNEGTA